MENIEELKEEIAVLKKRISILERKENNRRALNYIKIIIKVILIVTFIFGIWRGYEYLVHEIPNMMEDKIKDLNPFKRD